MKNLLNIILSCLLFIACGETSNKKVEQQVVATSSEKEEITNNTSADYSSLLTNYKCDMSVSELTKILGVPESDLALLESSTTDKCTFNLAGFGEKALTGGTRLYWGPSPSSKAQNKKEIKSYLERKNEGIKIMGMDIVLAETEDCYIAYQPAHGRVIIYNDNYDTAFLLNYGQKNVNNVRTDEQHEALRLKMTDLANYLLQKHRK